MNRASATQLRLSSAGSKLRNETLPSSCAAFANCAPPWLRPYPPLRLSRQCSPNRSARTRSPSARRQTSTRSAHPQLPVSHLALSSLRSQHAHRPQPYRATTGLPMQTVRLFLILSPYNRSQTCAGTSPHTCALTAKLRPYHPVLPECRSPNRSLHARLTRIALPTGCPCQTLRGVHLSQVSPSAP
jgi:hypothetical protein